MLIQHHAFLPHLYPGNRIITASWDGIPVARQDGSQSSRSLEPSGPVVGVGREAVEPAVFQAARAQGTGLQ